MKNNKQSILLVLAMTLVSITVMFVVNMILLKNLYTNNLLWAVCIYLIALILTAIGFYLYTVRLIQNTGYLALKLLIILFVEGGLSLSSYETMVKKNNLSTQQATITNELTILDNQISKTIVRHNSEVEQLTKEGFIDIVLSSCSTSRQEKELAKLSNLPLSSISPTDDANTIIKINIDHLGLTCSKAAVQTQLASINQLKDNVVNLINQKNDLNLKNSNLTNATSNNIAQEAVVKEFIKDYALKLILSISIILFFQHALFSNALKKMRYQASLEDKYFPREEMINLVIKPNKQYDIQIQKEYLSRHVLLRPFIPKNQSSSDYLKNNLFIKLNTAEHQDLINILHSNTHQLSNKSCLATDDEILKLVKFGVLNEKDLDHCCIYKIKFGFFNQYECYNPRLK